VDGESVKDLKVGLEPRAPRRVRAGNRKYALHVNGW
jgi:hypothetical protein